MQLLKITFLYLSVSWIAYEGIAQDEITLKNGDIIQAKVSEVGIAEIKYTRWENLSGPSYVVKKTEVFMIKYQNGTKDVISSPSSNSTSVATGGSPATLYLFRPKKFAGGAPEIIVGTAVPDEVIAKIHNGSWFKMEYSNFGELDFVTGVYSINTERFRYQIEPGKTYYIRCTLLSQGLKMMSQLELVDENTAKTEMGDLKEQRKSR